MKKCLINNSMCEHSQWFWVGRPIKVCIWCHPLLERKFQVVKAGIVKWNDNLAGLPCCCSQPWVWHMFFGKGLWWVMPTIKIHWIGLKHHKGTHIIFYGQQANTRSFPPVPAFGLIWVVLWLSFFRSAPSTFPSWACYPSRSLFPGVPSH